jgi:hypothetical protein
LMNALRLPSAAESSRRVGVPLESTYHHPGNCHNGVLNSQPW